MMDVIPPSLPIPFLSLPLSSFLFFSIPHYPLLTPFLVSLSPPFPLSPLLLVFSRSVAEDVVTISVKDCGAGLSPEDLGRLFQEGVQINPNKLQVLHIGKTASHNVSCKSHVYKSHLRNHLIQTVPIQTTSKQLQNGGGSGFGLFITKGIVKLHDASIWAESEGEGKGNDINIYCH